MGRRNVNYSFIDASIGIGLSSINLTSNNSDVTQDRTASAFTFSLGAVLKPKPIANLGLFLGWDSLGANDREVNWKYNKIWWLGLGINISFNQIKTETTVKGKNQSNKPK